MSPAQAEAIAVAALAYLAEQVELAARFLALSGLEAGDLRRAARDPAFLAGVLDFVVANEPVLLALAARTGRPVAEIETAQRLLSGEGSEPD
ncbi:MAG TPA: DUF3572 family protein [Afifellaceae bacterium]|nr:DUF3572 family protein [Afifellaceae bacterium]